MPEPSKVTAHTDGESPRPFTRGDAREAVRWLRACRETGDETEQRETLEALRQGLNASRLPGCEVLP